MDRLPFELKEYTKTSWVSKIAQNTWHPKIQNIVNSLFNLEILSVQEGIRKACRINISPKRLPELSKEMAQKNLFVIPVSQINKTQPYQNKIPVWNENQDWNYMVFICFKETVEYIESNDDLEIAKILGYPECCANFYKDIFVEQEYCDTTWQMAINDNNTPHDNLIYIQQPSIYCNNLMKNLGIRIVPHLPCSFNCEATNIFGKQFIELGEKLDYQKEMQDIQEILSWPAEWSALHGIAEIKTPIIRISTNTDATGQKYTVRLKGTSYPKEGATGTTYPYTISKGNAITQGRSFRSFAVPEVKQPWYYEDNGLSSFVWQTKSHNHLINLIKPLCPEKIVDLGCGNGALLLEMIEQIGLEKDSYQMTPYGCDIDQDKINHAKQLHPSFEDNFECCAINDYEFKQYDLIIYSVNSVGLDKFVQELAKHTQYILLYTYSDFDMSNEIIDLPNSSVVDSINEDRCNAILIQMT